MVMLQVKNSRKVEVEFIQRRLSRLNFKMERSFKKSWSTFALKYKCNLIDLVIAFPVTYFGTSCFGRFILC